MMPDAPACQELLALAAPVPVAVIIVAYNNDDDVLACLNSLINMSVRPVCIAVIDNSDIDTMLSEELDTFCKKHALLLQDAIEKSNNCYIVYKRHANGGFASANNFAITMLKHQEDIEYFWLLNPDTIVTQNALHTLIKTVQEDVNIGAVGSTLVRMDNSSCIQAAAGSRFNRWFGTTTSLLDGVHLQSIHKYSIADINSGLDYITGASMLVRKKVFETAGVLDERFFLYLEDTEWGIRVKKYGYSLAWAPESIVYHKDGGSTRPAYADYLMLRNRLLLLRIHYPLYIATAVASYGVVIIRRILRGQAKRIPLVCQALIDGLRGKQGRPDFIWLQRFDYNDGGKIGMPTGRSAFWKPGGRPA